MNKIQQTFSKNNKYIELLFFIFIALISTYIAVNIYEKFMLDDAYITYRYAENIASGSGFSYNIGEPSLGTTTPLYTMILSLFSLMFPNIPLVSLIIGLMSLLIITILVYKLLKQLNYTLGGFLSALLITINFEMILTYGMETLFYTMLVFASIYFYINKKMNITTILLALLVLTRVEGLILAILVFFGMYHENKNINKQFILFILLLLPWFVYSYHTFDILIPSTVSAKVIQSQSGLWPGSFASTAFNILFTKYFYISFLSIFGLIYCIKFEKKTLIIYYWMFFYFIAYTLINVPYYHWYFGPLVPAIIFSSSIGSLYIYKLIMNLKYISEMNCKVIIKKGIIISIILLLFAPLFFSDVHNVNGLLNGPIIEDSGNRQLFYMEIGKWLNQNTNSSESVATVEIGVIGYYSKRTIIDGAGLIQPEIANHLLNNNLTWSIINYEPDYIVLSPIFQWLLPFGTWINKYDVIDNHTVGSEEWYILKKKSFTDVSFPYYTFTENIYDAKFTNLPTDGIPISTIIINNEMMYSFFEHPFATNTSFITFNDVFIPDNTTLKFAICLDPQVWEIDKGDGVDFEISIQSNNNNNNTIQTVFSKYINPKTNENDRKWHNFEINLNEWSKKNISFTFETSSGPNNDSTYDWAWWGNVNIQNTSNPMPDWYVLKHKEGGIMAIDVVDNKLYSNEGESVHIDKNTNQYIEFTGWAADDLSKDGTVKTYLVLKGEADEIITPTRKKYRPDVANYFGVESYNDSGWSTMVQTRDFENECYNISLRILRTNEEEYFELNGDKPICFGQIPLP